MWMDLSRIQAGADDIDFRAAVRAFGRMVLRLLVFLVAAAPFAAGWTVTMVVRIAIAAAREGARTAKNQLGGS